MKKSLAALTVGVLTAGFALTGCTNSAPVEQQTWVLESFADESTPVESVQGVRSHFSLKDGKVTGNGGVNSFNGSYELSGTDISFSPLASTKMAGPPEALDQEMRFFQALESAAHVEVRDEKMTLSDGEDAVLMLLIPAAEG